MKTGAFCSGNGLCEFIVWAPFAEKMSVKLETFGGRNEAMEKDEKGYWRVVLENISPGTRYSYSLENTFGRPDPASHSQPEGVHGPSEVIDHNGFSWEDQRWEGIPLEKMIMYELHIGTFTPEGTFDAVIGRIDELADLGVNTLEIMPVAQFPGDRNWGYDGVYLYAVQNSYGGPEGLKRLVNECHKKGIAVILDVVYNHLGPEGNYLAEYGPYFTDRYHTPWGSALNFDDAYSNEVRNFYIENAFHWFDNYHIDALRLDAVHAIYDMSARPFLRDLAEKVEDFSAQKGRKYFLIAESDRNDEIVIRPRPLHGYGIDAQWSDDFHHSLRTLLTGERSGYYMDFGSMSHFAKACREGFVYSGEYSVYRKKDHGNSSRERPGHQFVVCSQNHDQVGNRMLGERLSSLISLESLKLAAAAVILSPYIPLIFMGEEYGETAPFLYFVSHSDPGLIEAVRQGRKNEFRAFSWQGEMPDAQDRNTFLMSKLTWENRRKQHHAVLLNYYKHLISLRNTIPALKSQDKSSCEVTSSEEDKFLVIKRWKDENEVLCLLNFNSRDIPVPLSPAGVEYSKLLDSSDAIWKGPGSLLPEKIISGTKIVVRSKSIGVIMKEKNI